jgi:hypothetical protein
VSAALGDRFGRPTEDRFGPNIAACTYDGPKLGHLIIRIQTNQTPVGFAENKESYPANGMPIDDLFGFADQAFSTVTGTGTYKVTTVVALVGSAEILVAARSTVSQEKALISDLADLLR